MKGLRPFRVRNLLKEDLVDCRESALEKDLVNAIVVVVVVVDGRMVLLVSTACER